LIVLILERVPVSLRGELTRWLLEARPGIFVGHVSAMVRDKLWDKVCEDAVATRVRRATSSNAGAGGSGAMLMHSADNEQGFAIKYYGDTTRSVVDFEGLTLALPIKSDGSASCTVWPTVNSTGPN